MKTLAHREADATLIARIRAVVLEGIRRRGDVYVIDLDHDNKASDIVFVHKPRQNGDVFAAFSVNPRHQREMNELKMALKYLANLTGPWEEMLDLAAKAFAERHDMSEFAAVATAHLPGRGGPLLANNLLASLEPFLAPHTKVLRQGFAKSPLDAIHVDYDLVDALAPKSYDDAQRARMRDQVRKNFESAMRSAEQTGRFRIQQIVPQFRKFVKGLFGASPELGAGKVLFVDDLYTTGATFQQAKAALPPGTPAECFVLVRG